MKKNMKKFEKKGQKHAIIIEKKAKKHENINKKRQKHECICEK